MTLKIKIYHGNELKTVCPNWHDKPSMVPNSIWSLFVRMIFNDRANKGEAYGWSFVKEV